MPFSLQAQAQISTAVAINRAARFRALSQRSTKLYAQLFLEVMPQNARDTLAAAQQLMQVGLDDLSRAQLKGAAALQLAAVSKRVAGLRTALVAAPNRDNLARVNSQAGLLLAEAERLTTALESASAQGSARLISLAGRQRMLSQRMAKNYLLTAAAVETPTLRAELTQDRADFVQALATLAAAPVSTSAIRNELQLAQGQWAFFDAAINRKPDADALRTVATTSERLLEVSNSLTNLYEVALRDVLGST